MLYLCYLCHYETTLKGNFIRHTIAIHLRQDLQFLAKNNFICFLCKYMSTTKGRLSEHMNVHVFKSKRKGHFPPTKRFTCDVCPYTTNKQSALKRHTMSHTGEKPYQCYLCNHKTAVKKSLRMHLMCIHQGIKWSTLITTLSNLPEKRYWCNICEYKSTTRKMLQNHVRRHTGEKPLRCFLCNYKSSRKDVMAVHMKSEHLGYKQLYECGICLEKLNNKIQLRAHVLAHTGMKMYNCYLCKYIFPKRKSFLNHLTKKHCDDNLYSNQLYCDNKGYTVPLY